MKQFFCIFLILVTNIFTACSTVRNTPLSNASPTNPINTPQSTESVEIDYMTSSCTKDSVDEFFNAAEKIEGDSLLSGVSFEKEHCYNVTPPAISAVTDYKIFKFDNSDASIILINGQIYNLCSSFGGYGFVNAAPWDYDNDGNIDLLVASSWGSGLHRSEISIFNTKTKKSTIIYDTLKADNPQVDLIITSSSVPSFSSKPLTDILENIEYMVSYADIEFNNENSADLKYTATGVAGTVILENGKPVFKSANK